MMKNFESSNYLIIFKKKDIMKLKIQMVEGSYTTIWKNPIEIETEDYPQLHDMSEKEVLDYLDQNSHNLPASPGGDAEDWSLYDELMGQEIELSKEKSNENSIEIWTQ